MAEVAVRATRPFAQVCIECHVVGVPEVANIRGTERGLLARRKHTARSQLLRRRSSIRSVRLTREREPVGASSAGDGGARLLHVPQPAPDVGVVRVDAHRSPQILDRRLQLPAGVGGVESIEPVLEHVGEVDDALGEVVEGLDVLVPLVELHPDLVEPYLQGLFESADANGDGVLDLSLIHI